MRPPPRQGSGHPFDRSLLASHLAVAAFRQKIENFTGIELDAHYLATAQERIEQEKATLSSELPLL